jgi:hypothetical protein
LAGYVSTHTATILAPSLFRFVTSQSQSDLNKASEYPDSVGFRKLALHDLGRTITS